MQLAISICFLLGGLLLYASARSRWAARKWAGAVKRRARVERVSYRKAWEKGGIIDDGRSFAEAALRFSDGERTVRGTLERKGMIGAPAEGGPVMVLLDRESGNWIPAREARSHWRLLAALAGLCFLAAAALLLDGRGILADLSDCQMESLNGVGGAALVLIGAVLALCTAACIWGLLPAAIRPMAGPAGWVVRYAMGRLEPVDARCEGLIRRVEGEDTTVYYPLFSYAGPEGTAEWHPPYPIRRSRFQRGGSYTLYRDRNTGKLYLRPDRLDLLAAPFSLIPFGFFVLLTASMGGSAAALLIYGGIGLARALLP